MCWHWPETKHPPRLLAYSTWGWSQKSKERKLVGQDKDGFISETKLHAQLKGNKEFIHCFQSECRCLFIYWQVCTVVAWKGKCCNCKHPPFLLHSLSFYDRSLCYVTWNTIWVSPFIFLCTPCLLAGGQSRKKRNRDKRKGRPYCSLQLQKTLWRGATPLLPQNINRKELIASSCTRENSGWVLGRTSLKEW